MFEINSSSFKVLFKMFCVVITINLVIWCAYKYSLDCDVTLVDFKKFHDDEKDIYPSVMLCFYNPFVNEKFENYGPEISSTTYKKFLQGENWSEKMTQVDYENVTIDINKYFLGYHVCYNSEEEDHRACNRLNKSTMKDGWKPPYVSLKTPYMKCFSVDVPFESKRSIIKLGIKLKTDIFPLATRPPEIMLDSEGDVIAGFSVLFHYQKQLLRNINFLKSNWPTRTENSSKDYSMNFILQNIEINSQRNKWKDPCKEGAPDYDKHKYEHLMKHKRVGCRPPYWTSENNMTLCSNSYAMSRLSRMLFRLRTFISDHRENLPCRKLTMLQFDYSEMDEHDSKPLFTITPTHANLLKDDPVYLEAFKLHLNKDSSYKGRMNNKVPKMPKSKTNLSRFSINVWFSNSEYREISRVREFGAQSLIGNIGGYIGIFIGYALMNVPDLIASIFNRIRRFFRKRNKKYNNDEDQNSVEFNDMNIDEVVAHKVKALERRMEERILSIEKEIKSVKLLESGRVARSISVN